MVEINRRNIQTLIVYERILKEVYTFIQVHFYISIRLYTYFAAVVHGLYGKLELIIKNTIN